MEWLVENPDVVAGAIVSIGAAAWILLKAIAKVTKTKVDDQLVEVIKEVKEGIEDETNE